MASIRELNPQDGEAADRMAGNRAQRCGEGTFLIPPYETGYRVGASFKRCRRTRFEEGPRAPSGSGARCSVSPGWSDELSRTRERDVRSILGKCGGNAARSRA